MRSVSNLTRVYNVYILYYLKSQFSSIALQCLFKLCAQANTLHASLSICVFIAVQSEKMTKKKPKFGVLPVQNMPIKSFEKETKMERPSRVIVKEQVSTKNMYTTNTFQIFVTEQLSSKVFLSGLLKRLMIELSLKKLIHLCFWQNVKS